MIEIIQTKKQSFLNAIRRREHEERLRLSREREWTIDQLALATLERRQDRMLVQLNELKEYVQSKKDSLAQFEQIRQILAQILTMPVTQGYRNKINRLILQSMICLAYHDLLDQDFCARHDLYDRLLYFLDSQNKVASAWVISNLCGNIKDPKDLFRKNFIIRGLIDSISKILQTKTFDLQLVQALIWLISNLFRPPDINFSLEEDPYFLRQTASFCSCIMQISIKDSRIQADWLGQRCLYILNNIYKSFPVDPATIRCQTLLQFVKQHPSRSLMLLGQLLNCQDNSWRQANSAQARRFLQSYQQGLEEMGLLEWVLKSCLEF